MSKYTTGPWKVRNGREIFCGNNRICYVNAASREPLSIKDYLDVAAANARLIAAAPELLEALQSYSLPIDTNNIALSCIEFGTEEVERELKRRAAIAKATGEA